MIAPVQNADIILLILEDDPSIRSLLIEDLRGLGFHNQIFEAENGQDGLTIFRKNKTVNMIISDIQMPIMDGIEFLKAVRSENLEIPILMLTSNEEKGVIVKCAKEKATNYIVKPWSRQMLATKLLSCLEKLSIT